MVLASGEDEAAESADHRDGREHERARHTKPLEQLTTRREGERSGLNACLAAAEESGHPLSWLSEDAGDGLADADAHHLDGQDAYLDGEDAHLDGENGLDGDGEPRDLGADDGYALGADAEAALDGDADVYLGAEHATDDVPAETT